MFLRERSVLDYGASSPAVYKARTQVLRYRPMMVETLWDSAVAKWGFAIDCKKLSQFYSTQSMRFLRVMEKSKLSP